MKRPLSFQLTVKHTLSAASLCKSIQRRLEWPNEPQSGCDAIGQVSQIHLQKVSLRLNPIKTSLKLQTDQLRNISPSYCHQKIKSRVYSSFQRLYNCLVAFVMSYEDVMYFPHVEFKKFSKNRNIFILYLLFDVVIKCLESAKPFSQCIHTIPPLHSSLHILNKVEDFSSQNRCVRILSAVSCAALLQQSGKYTHFEHLMSSIIN